MRVCAQQPFQEDFWNHAYTLLVYNNDARRWATYVLKRLKINRQYISRRYGFELTGDPDYVARYTGIINNDQHQALVTTYLPYAPQGVQYTCPGCS